MQEAGYPEFNFSFFSEEKLIRASTMKHFVFMRSLPDNAVRGGGEKRLLDYFRNVDFSKFRITVFATHDIFTEVFRKENLPVKVVIFNEYSTLRSFKRFWTVFVKLRELRPDKIISVQGGFCDFWVSDLLAGFIAAKGQLIDLHISSPKGQLFAKTSKRYFGIFPGLGLWWYRRMWWFIVRGRLPRKIIAVSTGAKRRMIEWYGYPEEKIEVIHHGIKLSDFFPDLDVKRKMRDQFGIPRDDVVIIATGRIAEEKRLERVLGAFEKIHDEFPYTWLLCVGDGPLKQEMEGRAGKLKCFAKVKFLGYQKQVPDFLRMSDIFVLSSDYEGLNNSMLEAMATGVIPVVTNVAGSDDAIIDGQNGFIVECSEDGIKEGVIKALRLSLEDRQKFAANAIQMVHSKFDVRNGIENMLQEVGLI